MKKDGLQHLLAVGVCVLASTASLCYAQAVSLSANLRGANEVPANASTNSGGTAVSIDGTTGVVTWITTSSILQTAATGHHIHQAASGVNGPVVVNFGGAYSGSVTVTPALATSIIANPAGFYVNLHTAAFPGGEIRGQLVPPPPPTASVPALSATMLLALALGLAALGMLVFRGSNRG